MPQLGVNSVKCAQPYIRSYVIEKNFFFSLGDRSDNVDAEVKSEPSKNAENDVKPEVLEETKTPRALHRTVSLFVRNVPPKISHNDIASVSMCIMRNFGWFNALKCLY